MGIQWGSKKLFGGNISSETASNVELGILIATVVMSEGENPNADKKLIEKVTEDASANLSKSQLKSISSLEKRAAEHEAKLSEYIKDPMKFDNQNFLKNAPTDAIREGIIQSRIEHLQQEINTFKNNIQKIKSGK
jgi:hypothetical protein